MAYKLAITLGKVICRLHRCAVKLVSGIPKEVLSFRQFSLRGLVAATREWCLIYLAWSLKGPHGLAVG